MLRSLLYFWRINLAVLFGASVATAVLTGALLVGDSVRGSLRDLTLERLGGIDHALVTDQFFRESLADDLAAHPGFSSTFTNIASAIITGGNATHANSNARSSGINIVGIDEQFVNLFSPASSSDSLIDLSAALKKSPRQTFQSIVINQALQQELGAAVGDQLILSFEKKSDIHRESLFGNKRSEDIIRSLRLTVSAVIADRDIGRFGLRPNQALPQNAFVSLPVCSVRLGSGTWLMLCSSLRKTASRQLRRRSR